MSRKSFKQECSVKSVQCVKQSGKKECLARVPKEEFQQECSGGVSSRVRRVSSKSVCKNVMQEYSGRVSRQSV